MAALSALFFRTGCQQNGNSHKCDPTRVLEANLVSNGHSDHSLACGEREGQGCRKTAISVVQFSCFAAILPIQGKRNSRWLYAWNIR